MNKNIVNLLLVVGIGCSANQSEKFLRDDNKEVVLDTTTNLMWEDNNNTKYFLDWNESIEYCESMVLGGYDDWHMPNFNELFNLRDPDKSNFIDETFKYVSKYYYWSSTTSPQNPSDAARVYFWDDDGGNDAPLYRPKSYDDYYVRCVRIAK